MPKDLRSFLADIDDETMVITKEVDPHRNLGALVSQRRGAIRFENVKGYPGWTVVDGLVCRRTLQGRALGVAAKEVVPELAKMLEAGPVKAVRVADGPVKEKKIFAKKGERLNLLELLPVAIHSELDPCPYIGSAWNILRDPDSGVTNSAFCRSMVDGRNDLALLVASRDNQTILRKYAERDEPIPWALVIGHHPAVEIAVNYFGGHLPEFSECDLAGRFLGEPLELVECETIDLCVPARAEIVLEGYFHPDRTLLEGPFGDFANNYMPFEAEQPTFEVRAVTMREDAIYRHLNATVYTDHQALTLTNEAMLYHELRTQTGVNIIDIYRPPWGGGFITIIQIEPRSEDDARNVLQASVETRSSKVVMLVNTDIDIYNAEDVMFALGTRVNPSRHLNVRDNFSTSFLDPSSDPVGGAPYVPRTTGRVFIDATIPCGVDESISRNYLRTKARGQEEFQLDEFHD